MVDMRLADERSLLDRDVSDHLSKNRGHMESYVIKNWLRSQYGRKTVTTRQVRASLRRLISSGKVNYAPSRGWHLV